MCVYLSTNLSDFSPTGPCSVKAASLQRSSRRVAMSNVVDAGRHCIHVRGLSFPNTALTETRKEGNVLFNDALNTFYLRLYGVRHMVKDPSYRERGNPLPSHRLLFAISSKSSFICIIPQTG